MIRLVLLVNYDVLAVNSDAKCLNGKTSHVKYLEFKFRRVSTYLLHKKTQII